jgi:hypothetical protein
MCVQHFMTIYRILLCASVLLLVDVARAQVSTIPAVRSVETVPYGMPVDTLDSAGFAAFLNGLQWAELGDTAVGPVSGYRLAWTLSQHGGMSAVTRGDGSAPASRDRTMLLIDREFVLPFRTAEGKRGLSVVADTPCGLICRTTWYYVEE